MLIEAMPEVLTWRAGADVMLRVYEAYTDLLSKQLGKLLAELQVPNANLAQELRVVMAAASDEAFARVMTAPETSYRLLWQPYDAATSAKFIMQAFLAEAAREGANVTFAEEAWTALGDVGFLPDQPMLQQPRINALLIDFISPYARSVDLGNGDIITPRGEFSDAESARIISQLESACEQLGRISPLIRDFAARFNRVLILQKDPTDPANFTSGSTGQFIGRSFLSNPHLDAVDEVGLAEGIVHEAIHALLYMQERQKDWVCSRELYLPNQILISPWTGSCLALRSFLQACFVWYGILHLWSQSLLAGEFERQKVKSRIIVSSRGFFAGQLVDHLAPWRDGISDDVIQAITTMQSNVLEAKEAWA
jgi:hypothetical protein